MSVPQTPPQPSLFSVENLLVDRFDPADSYRLFRERIYPRLLAARAELEQCYCMDNGRPGREPVLLLGITLLQFMEELPDRQAVAMLKYHLGWKLALGQDLDVEDLDSSLLTYFRQRLLAHEQSKLLFDTVLSALIETGLVPKRGKRRLDSTHVLGLLADLARTEKLQQTMRLALQYLQPRLESLPDWFEDLMHCYIYTQPDWRMTQQQVSAYCQRFGQDLHRLLQWLRQEHPAHLQQQPLALLVRLEQESFTPAEGTLQYSGTKPGALCTPHDPDALRGRKGKQAWTGYKVQISETVSETGACGKQPTSNFITEAHTEPASAADVKSLAEVRKAESAAGLEVPTQRFVDSNYVSGQTLREEQDSQGELMGPLTSCKEHPAITEGFKIEVDGRHGLCPAGHANEFRYVCDDKARANGTIHLLWKHCCRTCGRRATCVDKFGKRHIRLRVDWPLLQKRREQQKSPEFDQQMHQRKGIEGTISELVRGHGMRRTRYRSLAKTALCNWMIAAACNVKRWLRLLQWSLQPIGAV